ncbi:MAG: hypothetical protein HYT36_03325 [Candidatus Staskawiczbacteria bacterium]|nr:hypothetical protein [Candidatus Staskawiczbacteria bacterium]
MKKIFVYILLFSSMGLIFAKEALAVCPLCAIAVGSGIGFSRWIGVDDSVTGLWIGGLIVSMIAWTISWFDKKNIRFKGKTILAVFGFYIITVVPLYFYGLLGNVQNSLFNWGFFYFDKLTIGIIAGSSAFYFGASLYYFLKEKNQGKAYFPFQKVVMPVSPLIILSLIFYYLTK